MSRAGRVAGLLGLSAVAGGIAALFGNHTAVELAVLSTLVVVGELLELRPVGRAPLPLSFAVVVVLVRAGTPREVVVCAICAQVFSLFVRDGAGRLRAHTVVAAERITETLAAGAAYRVVIQALSGENATATVLGALGAAAIAQILVADVLVLARDRTVAPLRSRGADLALVTSGILMAVGYAGVDGKGDLGLWGVFLFAIPLLAAWYSFELVASTRRSYEQTVRALSVAPELAGLVPKGHAERVADLGVALARELGLGTTEMDDVKTAALLHHLGAVCIDEPALDQRLDPAEVSAAGASMLSASEALAAAGEVIAAEPQLHRPPDSVAGSFPAALGGQILKVASAYDELTDGDDAHAAWAVEALFTGPAYVYDGRVLAALERVLVSQGRLTSTRVPRGA